MSQQRLNPRDQPLHPEAHHPHQRPELDVQLALPQVGQQRGGEGPEGGGGGLSAAVGVDIEEEAGALVEGLRVFGVQLVVGEEHAVAAEGVSAPAPAPAGQVGVRVAVACG